MKWMNKSVTAILFIVLFLMIVMVFATNITGGVFGYQLKTVLSGSMEPEIQTGAIIAAKQAKDGSNVNKGDIVTFITKDNELVTHRIHEVKENGEEYVTKGDNNKKTDSDPLLADNIVAKYTGFTIPYVGYAANYVNTKLGTALLAIIPGLLLIGYSCITIVRTFKGRNGIKSNEESIKVKYRIIS